MQYEFQFHLTSLFKAMLGSCTGIGILLLLAKKEYNMQKNRLVNQAFPKVPEETEFVPLPTQLKNFK